MKTPIKVGQYNIKYLGDNFRKHFGQVKCSSKKTKFQTRLLEKPMLDKEILAEWRPAETTLDEMVYALYINQSLLTNGYFNIFYIRDVEKTLWAVGAHWIEFDGGWRIFADSVEHSDGWGAGSQVVSRSFRVAPKPDSGISEILDTLENAVKELRKLL